MKAKETHEIQPHHQSWIPLPHFYLDRSCDALKFDEGDAGGVKLGTRFGRGGGLRCGQDDLARGWLGERWVANGAWVNDGAYVGNGAWVGGEMED